MAFSKNLMVTTCFLSFLYQSIMLRIEKQEKMRSEPFFIKLILDIL